MADMARFETRTSPLAGRFWRPLLIAAGIAFVAIGTVGIFVPLLPTTIFLILAGACFGKSSPGAYRWLTTNRVFGPMLRDYYEGHGATLRTKVVSITTLWVGLGLAAWFFGNAWIDGALAVIGVAVTVHLVRLQTVRRP